MINNGHHGGIDDEYRDLPELTRWMRSNTGPEALERGIRPPAGHLPGKPAPALIAWFLVRLPDPFAVTPTTGQRRALCLAPRVSPMALAGAGTGDRTPPPQAPGMSSAQRAPPRLRLIQRPEACRGPCRSRRRDRHLHPDWSRILRDITCCGVVRLQVGNDRARRQFDGGTWSAAVHGRAAWLDGPAWRSPV